MGRAKEELSRTRRCAGAWGSGKDRWLGRHLRGEVAGNRAAKMRGGRRMTMMMTTVDWDVVPVDVML